MNEQPINPLERAIKAAGSQAELAKLLGGHVSQQVVSKWLRCRGVPPSKYWKEIEEKLGVPAVDFLEYEHSHRPGAEAAA